MTDIEIEQKQTSSVVVSSVVVSSVVVKKTRTKKQQECLQSCFVENTKTLEIGIDEAGRGPMLGRVYTAAVILPKDNTFDHSLMKDSKRFHSDKKIKEAAEYIKKNAIIWSVQYAERDEIDTLNIRNATHVAMHKCVLDIIQRLNGISNNTTAVAAEYHLLVDGNDFKPFVMMNHEEGFLQVQHTCIEGGDNKYSAIAAGSILAKVARDQYIDDLCNEHPELDERYGLRSNKGYGTKIHMDGIKKYGISPYHRTSFGICKQF